MIRFLIRSWVYPFYKAYAGFFLAIFLLAAGVLRGDEHLAIALFFTGHISNLLYPAAGMMLFELLTIHFSIRWISEARNRSIRELIFTDPIPKVKVLVTVLICLQLPVVIYTVFLIAVALYAMNIHTLLVIAIIGIIKIILYVRIMDRLLLFPREKRFKSPLYYRFPSWVSLPWVLLFLRYFIHEKFLSVLLTKIFSFLLLWISVILISTVDHYERFAAISISLVFLSNAFLSYNLFRLQYTDMNFLRNLPFRPLSIISQVLITLSILTLPEIIFTFRNFSQVLTTAMIAANILHGIALLIFLYGSQVYFHADLKSFIPRLFWGSLLLIILLLFDFPVYLLAVLLYILTLYFYFKGYYQFESVYYKSIDI